MVEEAYRSNAGIVGPKVVDRDHPDILLEVGMSVDHYGVPFSGIEPDEVDQEQHDGVRDVFYVSHTAMLVRADLFHELGGFDPATVPRRRRHRSLLAGAARRRARDRRARRRGRATAGDRVVDARRARDRPARRAARRDALARPPALQVVLGARARVGAPRRVRARASFEALGLLVDRPGRRGPARSCRAGCRRSRIPGELRRARAGSAAAPPRRRRRRARPHDPRQRAAARAS